MSKYFVPDSVADEIHEREIPDQMIAGVMAIAMWSGIDAYDGCGCSGEEYLTEVPNNRDYHETENGVGVLEVNTDRSHYYAIPFNSDQEAFPVLKELLLDNADMLDLGEEGDEEYDQVADAESLEDLGAWGDSGPIMLLVEGDQGVWTGFSSADRDSLGGPLPLPVGEFIGNGDPNFYLTAGKPAGEKVFCTPSVDFPKPGDTHPLYQAHLDAEEELAESE